MDANEEFQSYMVKKMEDINEQHKEWSTYKGLGFYLYILISYAWER